MSDNQKTSPAAADAELQRECLEERKFTLEEAIARMAGPGAMKGESPVTRLRQAEIEIGSWLSTHLRDAGGTLEVVLHRRVNQSELMLNDFEQPLVVLAGYCQQVLDSDCLLAELVREADVEWGRLMDERPRFEPKNAAHHPDDPYTVASVRNTLTGLLKQLTAGD